MFNKKDNAFARAWSKKIAAFNLLGGKCCVCGIDDLFVLEFHHFQGEKEKKFSRLFCSHSRWENVVKELQKCQLLCSNCHAELHAKKGRASSLKIKLMQISKKDKCERCGYISDKDTSSVLCFHHPKNDKHFNISDALTRKYSATFEDIVDEILKCEILCRNCHTKEHRDIDRFAKLKNVIEMMVKNPKTKQPKINRLEMVRLRENGLNISQIAKQLGCAKSTVSMALSKMSV
jgi:hypothetical protein